MEDIIYVLYRDGKMLPKDIGRKVVYFDLDNVQKTIDTLSKLYAKEILNNKYKSNWNNKINYSKEELKKEIERQKQRFSIKIFKEYKEEV